jgi:hypothetical protein
MAHLYLSQKSLYYSFSRSVLYLIYKYKKRDAYLILSTLNRPEAEEKRTNKLSFSRGI